MSEKPQASVRPNSLKIFWESLTLFGRRAPTYCLVSLPYWICYGLSVWGATLLLLPYKGGMSFDTGIFFLGVFEEILEFALIMGLIPVHLLSMSATTAGWGVLRHLEGETPSVMEMVWKPISIWKPSACCTLLLFLFMFVLLCGANLIFLSLLKIGANFLTLSAFLLYLVFGCVLTRYSHYPFYMFQILAEEGLGFLDSIKRSVALSKGRWYFLSNISSQMILLLFSVPLLLLFTNLEIVPSEEGHTFELAQSTLVFQSMFFWPAVISPFLGVWCAVEYHHARRMEDA